MVERPGKNYISERAMHTQDLSLFSGTASHELTAALARNLGHRVSPSGVERFPDGELSVHLDEAVRGRHVFIVQSLCPPVTENLFELLLFVDACRRAAAARITAVVPYLGYARADKRHGLREPITASLVATLLQAAGLDHLVTVDLHAAQIEGFYHLPVDNLSAVSLMCDELKHRLSPGTVVVSPDAGRVATAGDYARRLDATVAVLQKQRQTGAETKVLKVIGDVRDRPCLIIDDMITTGGTIAHAVTALLDAGARPDIMVAATHGVLVAGARERLRHPAVREVVVTDTIARPPSDSSQPTVVSLAPLLARAIRHLANAESISDLFR